MNIGEWQHNMSFTEVAIVVANDMCAVWDKTDIPHFGTHNLQVVKKKEEKILKKSKEILKIPAQKRNNVKLAQTWSKLFDIALCPHRVKTSVSEEEDNESDWELEVGDYNTVTEYNTPQLRRFSRECDWFKQSTRAGDKTVNALLKDLGRVTKTEQKLLVWSIIPY